MNIEMGFRLVFVGLTTENIVSYGLIYPFKILSSQIIIFLYGAFVLPVDSVKFLSKHIGTHKQQVKW